MSTVPVIVEQTYNAPARKVWEAITDKNKMKQWYFDIAEFKPEVGFEFNFTASKDEKVYVHLCRVTEVIKEKKISYSWRFEGFPGDSLVTFELFPEGDQTTLRLTHSNLETLAAGHEDFKKENFMAGWNDIIGKSLKEFVER